SPGAGAALTCLRLAPALTASFPAFPAARLAGGLGRLRGALPVPKERRLALRRRESRKREWHGRQRMLSWVAMARWTRAIRVVLVDRRCRASHSMMGTFRFTDNASWT